MSYEPQPLEQVAGTPNLYFAPKPVDIGVVIPVPPDDGTFVLTATDGVITWEAAS